MICRRFWDVYQCVDSLCLSDCFFVLGEVMGDIAVLLPPSWIWFGGDLVRCSSWFFTRLSMFWYLIFKRLLSCVETRWEFWFGLLWLVWFLDLCSGLLCSIWFSWYGFLWSWPSVLIDCSWSHLSGRFCLCWSGGVCTLLVWSSWYTLVRSDRVCSVLLCPSLVCSLWSASVWSMMLCSRQACSR